MHREIEPQIFINVGVLCAQCKVTVPTQRPPKLTWIEIGDAISKISTRESHPFAFFEDDQFDAIVSCFNRTGTPPRKSLATNPPRQIGVPSHASARNHTCRFIDKAAWVDFDFCLPKDKSELVRALKMAGRISEKTVAKFKQRTIYKSSFGRDLVARSCDKEDSDIAKQLWVALRLSTGHRW